MECNPVLQQLEEIRKPPEGAKMYIGDISLDDILDQEFEEITPVEPQKLEEVSQPCGLISEERDLETSDRFKVTSLTSKGNFPSSDNDDSPQDIDTILKEALDDYEAQLSSAED